MGSVGGSIGAVAGGLTGGSLFGPVGALLGAGAGSQVAGGQGLGQMLGTENNYSATTPKLQTQNLLPSIQQTQGGLGGIQGNQSALAQALMAQSQGQGPNPAQSMLQQATNQNARQAAGLVAGTKGINPALAARYAGQNAAMANQQAANQGATMRAQQQLAAQGQLGGLYGQMGQQNLSQQQILQEAQARQNQQALEGQLGTQQINAGVASGNAQGNRQLIGGLLGGAGSALGGLLQGGAMAASHGAFVPGKAKKKGDHPDNDTVPAMLSPGEVVLPRSVVDHEDAPEAAKAFVEHLLKRKGKK